MKMYALRSFNPLFIGARLRTSTVLKRKLETKEVSIPSSSGHVFGLVGCNLFRRPGLASFNPLFIGARLRTRSSQRPRRRGP